ncbi:hypothetical protein BYT27DRAFT_7099759 [Phlegmacium glaucopus]|nr:hypothetical protein BYT27DRAFT_7099759 [Phlegmacium glaucopus]
MARCEFINDLIPLIFESHNHWWPRDLLALATVSPCWLIHARKRLYAHPIIYSFSASTLLARTLAENPSLIPLITGITLQPMQTSDLASRLETGPLPSLRSLLALEGLNRVTLGGELAVKAARFLKLIAVPDVVDELHIDGSLVGHRLSCPPSLEWDESIAFQFPNLKKLRLTRVELDISWPSVQFPLPISSLCLDNVNITHGFLPHLLNGTRVLGQLHVKTKDAADYDEQIQLVLASCAVGCLHYEVERERHGNAFVLDGDMSSTKTLHCLHLRGLFVDPGLVTGISMMYRNLVELVVCGRQVGVGAKEWATLIASGGFESVRRIGLPWGNWENDEVEEVRSACVSRGIGVVM